MADVGGGGAAGRVAVANRSRPRWRFGAVVALLLLSLSGCAITRSSTLPPEPVPATRSAFESFSGLVLPAQATHLDLRAWTTDDGEPMYSVSFDLPTAEVDQFTTAGQLGRTLRMTTVPAGIRKRFGYQGDGSAGMRWIAGSLPSNMGVQRELFAVGTSAAGAHVQVHAYRMGGR